MEFYDEIVAQEELPHTEPVEGNQIDDAVIKLENEIDKAFNIVEKRFNSLWSQTSTNANEIGEKYKIEEHRKQLLDQLKHTKDNINDKAKVKENMEKIEAQLRNVSHHIPELNLHKVQTKAEAALDNIDATLEQVEKQAGKYATQFASYFSNIVSVRPASSEGNTEEEPDTLFKAPLVKSEYYGFSRYDNDLYKLHTTAAIYMSVDKDVEEEVRTFKIDSKTNEISDLLTKYPKTLTPLMNELVPVKVSYDLFWYRYFKAEAMLKESELKRKKLLEKKGSSNADEVLLDEEKFVWDEDDEEDYLVLEGKGSDEKNSTGKNKSTLSRQGKDETKNGAGEQEVVNNNDDKDNDDDWE